MWTIAEVPNAFHEIAPLADKYGYLSACYGSTLKTGVGRDLDVLMVSLFQQKNDWRGFLAAFGGSIVKQYERRDRGNHSYEVEREGKLYHFIFGRF